MLSDEKPRIVRKRVLTRSLSQDQDLGRIPPVAEKLFENSGWMSIMTDIAITAAVAEFKVKI